MFPPCAISCMPAVMSRYPGKWENKLTRAMSPCYSMDNCFTALKRCTLKRISEPGSLTAQVSGQWGASKKENGKMREKRWGSNLYYS